LAKALRDEFARLAGGPFVPGTDNRADQMIYRAVRGEYGTLPSIGMSKYSLLEDCVRSGLEGFSARVKRGEFDEKAVENLVSKDYIRKQILSDARVREYKDAHRWDVKRPKLY
jgi:hypothetical protein